MPSGTSRPLCTVVMAVPSRVWSADVPRVVPPAAVVCASSTIQKTATALAAQETTRKKTRTKMKRKPPMTIWTIS